MVRHILTMAAFANDHSAKLSKIFGNVSIVSVIIWLFMRFLKYDFWLEISLRVQKIAIIAYDNKVASCL